MYAIKHLLSQICTLESAIRHDTITYITIQLQLNKELEIHWYVYIQYNSEKFSYGAEI